jgi:DNA-binding NarL/FixJ family response regulator
VRVLLVDDHAIVRQALAAVLKAEPDVEVIGEAGNGLAAVEQTQALHPEVILMDVFMPR